MRLFVGIDLDPVVKRYVYNVSQLLKYELNDIRASWVNEENYHITLRFIGEVSSEEIEIIDNKLSNIKIQPFSLALDRLGTFGNPPKVIWLGVKESQYLYDLAKMINEILEGDITKFHPHITLARIKSPVSLNVIKNVLQKSIKSIQWDVKEFVLFRSQLSRKGSIYTPIKKYPLL